MKNATILLVLIVVATATPVIGYFGVSSYVRHRDASLRYAALQRQQREVEVYSEQVLEYRRFADRVERFIRSAQTTGVADSGWNRHQVDIKNRVASFGELARLIDDAAGGENYYFLPYRLQIQSPGAGSTVNPFRRSGARASRDEVKVSLTGDFLVPVQ